MPFLIFMGCSFGPFTGTISENLKIKKLRKSLADGGFSSAALSSIMRLKIMSGYDMLEESAGVFSHIGYP